MAEPERVLIFEVAPGFERWRGASAVVIAIAAWSGGAVGFDVPVFQTDDGTVLLGVFQVKAALNAREVAHARLENPELCREIGL